MSPARSSSAMPPRCMPPRVLPLTPTHGLVDELMTREQLYTMISRGRHANHLYVPGVEAADLHHHGLIRAGVHEPTAHETLHRILNRSSLPISATTAA